MGRERQVDIDGTEGIVSTTRSSWLSESTCKLERMQNQTHEMDMKVTTKLYITIKRIKQTWREGVQVMDGNWE